MEKQIIFRITAYTEAAGKYNETAPNKGNEDNFFVDENLEDKVPQIFHTDKEILLSSCGMLMAVADGMGGMNAGEVASEIAVNTIKDFFAPGKITPDLAKTHESRKQYVENIIVEADRRIKADAKHNPDYEGMGSTIIIAWLVDDELTVSWCGDSRAYRFNPVRGLQPLSEDHSYVQELVNKGLITYDQAFDHPQGNIITRSLGDPSKKAKPETRLFTVYNSDIIMLCSDGLSGVLRDEEIEDIIRENRSSMLDCREALWDAAEKAGWYDNVTIILCEIIKGTTDTPEELLQEEPETSSTEKTFWNQSINIRTNRKSLFGILGVILFLVIVGIVCFKKDNIKTLFQPENVIEEELVQDTLGNIDAEAADSLWGEKTGEINKEIESLTKDKTNNASEEKSQPEEKPSGDPVNEDSPHNELHPATEGPQQDDLIIVEENTKKVEHIVQAGETLYRITKDILANNPGFELKEVKMNGNTITNNPGNLSPNDTLVFFLELKKEQ